MHLAGLIPGVLLLVVSAPPLCSANKYADQLYEDLLYWYQKNVRPVANASDIVHVKFGASLIRIIELNEVNQVLTTNLWLELEWSDVNLQWDPAEYGGIRKLHVPADQIWVPDIVLYNNAHGSPQITIFVDALVNYDGRVCWKPPAIYNSFCTIDIEYFPYDQQVCMLKFGGWTYTGPYLNMVQVVVMPGENIEEPCPNVAELNDDQNAGCKGYVQTGMDLSNFQPNAEWDLLFLESRRSEQLYPGCCGAEFYVDITFRMGLRRKPLFYTVNLVIPCMLIAILTTFVFYIPSRDKKVTFSISILVTLIFFFLVLIDLIPPTSLVIPLIGKYLLFTIMLVFVAITISIVTLNLFHRSGATHTMPAWVRWLFLQKLPRPLCIKPQDDPVSDSDTDDDTDSGIFKTFASSGSNERRPSPYFMSVQQYANTQIRLSQLAELRGMHPDLIRRMVDNVSFIAEHYRALQAEDKVFYTVPPVFYESPTAPHRKLSNSAAYHVQVTEDWSYVAMVLDRLFLIIFTMVNIIGTVSIILQAPSLYDMTEPMKKMPQNQPLGGECIFNQTS